jgi:hypothetical protein
MPTYTCHSANWLAASKGLLQPTACRQYTHPHYMHTHSLLCCLCCFCCCTCSSQAVHLDPVHCSSCKRWPAGMGRHGLDSGSGGDQRWHWAVPGRKSREGATLHDCFSHIQDTEWSVYHPTMVAVCCVVYAVQLASCGAPQAVCSCVVAAVCSRSNSTISSSTSSSVNYGGVIISCPF